MGHWFKDIPKWRFREDRDPNGRRSERDNQRSKCYAAERCVSFWTTHKFESFEEVEVYVFALTNSARFKERFGKRTIRVERWPDNKSATGAYFSETSGRIRMPAWSWRKIIVLHEIAHCLTPPSSGGVHGRHWARTYLSLVKMEMGMTRYRELKEQFKRFKVKSSPKRPYKEAPSELLVHAKRKANG